MQYLKFTRQGEGMEIPFGGNFHGVAMASMREPVHKSVGSEGVGHIMTDLLRVLELTLSLVASEPGQAF
jgi:hypothetical protein